MKKLLALVLALVMTMSLVTISNAAFKDADSIDYKEAVDVLNAVGVLIGDENGNFNAKAELTRAQAAKIVAYLDLGESVAEALPAVQVFTDVPTDHWAAKYIAYCADAGYINGVGDGKFDPEGKLTGYAFGKLLLCALGYDATIEEMTGANWSIKVAKLMEKNDIAKSVDKLGSANLTREEAAQYALNALKATTVEYDDKGSTITAGDVTIVSGAKKAQVVVNSNERYSQIDDKTATIDGVTATTVELGEKLYKNLKLKTENSDAEDKLGRPAHTWYNGADENSDTKIGTYADTAAKTFVISKATTLASLIKDNDIKLTDDADTNSITSLAIGDVVEMFKDSDSGKINLVIKYSYGFDKIEKISKAAKDAKYDYLVKIGNSTYKDTDIAGFSTSWEKDDYVVYIEASNTLVYCAAAKSVSGKMTAQGTDYVKVDGTKYTAYAAAISDLDDDYTNEYNFYLDPNGFVVGVEKVTDKATSKDYLYLSQVEIKNAGEGLKTSDDAYGMAKVIFMDGTEKKIDLFVKKATKALSGDDYKGTIAKDAWYYVDPTNDKYTALAGDAGVADDTAEGDFEEGFYSYTVKDGMYVLSADMDVEDKTVVVSDATTIELAKKSAIATYTVESDNIDKTVNSKTVLTLIGDSVKTYTGISNFPTATYIVGTDDVDGILVELDKDAKVITNIYVVGSTETNDSTWAFIASKGDKTTDGTLWTVYVDGEAKSYYGDNSTAKGLYDITVNDKNEITEDATDGVVYGTVASIDDSFITIEGDDGVDIVYYLADKVAIYNVSGDYTGEKFDLSKGDVVAMGTKLVDGDETAEVIYIIDAPELKSVAYGTSADGDEALEFVQNGNEIILTGTKKTVTINFTDDEDKAKTIEISADATEIVYYTDASEDGTIGDGIAITINVESMIAAD